LPNINKERHEALKSSEVMGCVREILPQKIPQIQLQLALAHSGVFDNENAKGHPTKLKAA